MKLKGIEIKPGMVIVTKNTTYVAFPLDESYHSLAFANITRGGWTTCMPEGSIEEIHDLPTGEKIDSGKLLWTIERYKEVTMDEIAKKFGILVKQLRIKKG